MSHKFYFADGANTHREHMRTRCPDAKPLGRITLHGHRLAFRGVADVVRQKGAHVSGVLWEITASDEAALDRFEGYPRLYVKRLAPISINGETHHVMFYVMRAKGDSFSPPPAAYERTLREGYKHFRVSTAQIDTAVREARKSDSAPAYVSKWHREERDSKAGPKGSSAFLSRAAPPARTPRVSPEDRQQLDAAERRMDDLARQLRDARARPLPKQPSSPVEAAARQLSLLGYRHGNWRGSIVERLRDEETDARSTLDSIEQAKGVE